MNRIYGLLGCAAFVACGGRTMNLGGTSTDSVVITGTLSGGPGSTIPGATLCTVPPPEDAGAPTVDAGADLAPLLGTWSGTSAGANVPAVATVLAFAESANGVIGGTVTIGTGSVPPAYADQSYPPDSWAFPYNGFPYTATHVTFDGTHLSLALTSGELWKSWCGLQTSYSWAPNVTGMCGCAPNWAGSGDLFPGYSTYSITNPTTGQSVQVTGDFNIFMQCNDASGKSPPCSCSSAGCTVDMGATDALIDLTLTPGHLDGTLSANTLYWGSLLEDVHLSR